MHADAAGNLAVIGVMFEHGATSAGLDKLWAQMPTSKNTPTALKAAFSPIDILPAPLDTIVKLLPLQYLAYFPSAVFLQKVQGRDLWIGLTVQAAWVLFFIVACRVTYWRGIKRYSGFGG